jgi:hypothetical protein
MPVQVTVAALAVLVFADIRHDLRRASEATRAWSRTTAVWVATDALGPGEPVLDGVAVRDVPEALLPDGAVAATTPLAGVTTGRTLAPGAVLTALDLRGSGVAASSLIPAGWLIVPIHTAAAGLLSPGDRVRVAADGTMVSPSGVVVEPGSEDVPTLLAVPAERAPTVAAALDGLTLVLEP